ncbi:hypothetical protein GCM10010222_09920 [Streptomyces tanashiensis]|nr:hypothetical protein GCM10010222_09920 [Streptomyces tanashiensis]
MAAGRAVLGARASAPPPVKSRRDAACEGPAGLPPVKAYRMATGATGVPVPPTKGSGIAESRKA